jgi:hypothetical protein
MSRDLLNLRCGKPQSKIAAEQTTQLDSLLIRGYRSEGVMMKINLEPMFLVRAGKVDVVV